jgi:hypothetical protein
VHSLAAAGSRDPGSPGEQVDAGLPRLRREVDSSYVEGSRILLVLDPWRSVVLLVAGDKPRQWDKWYRTAIPRAEYFHDDYIAERGKEMGL